MKISSLLREAEKPNQGTVNQLPIDKDLIYQAKNKYPGYSGEQAVLISILDDKKDQEKTDLVQNRLIDTQKRENERLRGAVDSLGQELQDFEQQSIETDREVERLKQLSSTLTTGGSDIKRKAKVSADDLEKLQQDLETLKTKPGMDPKKFQNIELQIKQIANNPSVDDKDLAKVNSLVITLNNQKNVGDELYKRLEDQLVATQTELDKKENRFKGYIDKKKSEVGYIQQSHATDIKKYSDIVKGYQQEIQSFDKQMSGLTAQLEKVQQEVQKERGIAVQLRAGTQQDAQDISDMKDQIQGQLELITNISDKMTRQASNDNVIQEPTGAGPQASVLDTMNKGQEVEKKITKGAEQMLNRKLAEDKTFKPLQKYKNPKYNEWITKHLPALINVFKNKYWRELERPESEYSDEQIHYIIEKYTPMLYNLGDEYTPLTAEQVENWMTVVKNKLWEQPIQKQLDLFNESLDKTYSRMLDDIINLAYIKKG